MCQLLFTRYCHIVVGMFTNAIRWKCLYIWLSFSSSIAVYIAVNQPRSHPPFCLHLSAIEWTFNPYIYDKNISWARNREREKYQPELKPKDSVTKRMRCRDFGQLLVSSWCFASYKCRLMRSDAIEMESCESKLNHESIVNGAQD